MGGRGGSGTGGTGGGGGGPVGDQIRQAYDQLLPTHSAAGWVPIADVRDALPHLSRDQVTDGLKQLARSDQRVKLIRWDDQKVLTPAQRAASFTFGGAPIHAVRIDRR